MRNFVLLFGILCIFANEVPGQTIVPDSTIVSGRWTRINAPYEINGLATVPMGQTLTIEPGVEIRFKTGTDFKYSGDNKVDVGHLTVQGRLIARGTSSQRIVFTRQGSSGNWGCILIINKDSNSILEYCKIECANKIDSYDGAITNFNRRLSLIHSKIINNAGNGIYSQDSYPEIRNCIIAFNRGYGVYLRTGNYIWSTKLINNSIVGNGDVGLVVYQTNCQIINSVFWGNAKSLSVTSSASSISYTLVQEDFLTKSSGFTIGKGMIYNLDPQFVDLYNSDFHLKPTSPGIDQGDPLSEYQNEPEDNGDRINLGAYGNTTETEKTENLPRITWLSAKEGHMFGGDTLKIKGKYFLASKQNGKILFDNTEVVKYLFWSNDSLVCITPPHMPDNVSIFIINKDLIQGVGFECFIYKSPVISQNSPLFLKCSGNEKVSLNGKLFGLKQNGVHILVNKTEASGYQSWNDSAMVLTSPPNPEGLANLTFRLNDTIFYDFKGLFYYTGTTFIELCNNIPDTLKQGQAYLLNCSDTIPAGKTLIVQPGVVIIAKQNTKNPVLITVDGSIIAKGAANDSINFLSIPYEKNLWGGIRLTGNSAFGFCRIRNAGTGITQESGTSTIENSSIEENETGIYYYGDNKIVKSRINNCVISDNNIGIKAEASGNKSRGTAEVEVISSSVTGNKNNGIELSGHGYVTSGSIPVSQSSTVYFSLKNSVISDNRGYAVSLYASGFTFAAIPYSGSRSGYARITSYNSIFNNNSKGITAERGNKNPQSTITAYFYNSNFWKNNSVFNLDANYVFFYNTNLWDNNVSGMPTGICDSLVFKSCNLNDLNVVKTGNNNISSDPKYTSPETGDFSLHAGSPCIDAGNNKYVDFTTDFPGKARIWNATGKDSAIVDIGAFEYNAPCFSITENISICHGQSYLGWTTSGKYQRILHTGAGCDSVVNTVLTVNPVYNITENKTICQGQSYQGWTTSGTYQRPLKSKAGCDSLVTTILTVIPPLTLSSPLTGSVCTKNLFTYIPTSDTPGTTFTWKRNSVSGISNPAATGVGQVSEILVNTYTYSKNVTYIYTLTNSGCTNVQNVVVTVNPQPYLSSTKTYGPVCNNTTFTYTPTSSVSSTTFTWTRATIPGISNAEGNGTVKISETLNNTTPNVITVPYIIKLTAAGCDSFQTVTVTVKPTPVLSSLAPPAICNGTLFSYSPTSEIIGTTFSWKRVAVTGISNPAATGSGSISETLVNTTTKPVTVTYEYTLGQTGCASNKENVSIVVNPVYNITENKTICQGQSYNGWTTPGTYKRTLKSKTGCDSVVTTILTFHPSYQPLVTQTGDTLKSVNLYKTYQWHNEAGMIAEATGNRHIISRSGKYHLVVTDENGCTNTSAAISAIWSDTREFVSGEFMYSIIPNPGRGRFIFRMDSGHDSDITLRLINPAGQVIETRQVKKMTQNHTEQFDVSHLSKGIYLLVVSSESFQTGEKIVVQ